MEHKQKTDLHFLSRQKKTRPTAVNVRKRIGRVLCSIGLVFITAYGGIRAISHSAAPDHTVQTAFTAALPNQLEHMTLPKKAVATPPIKISGHKVNRTVAATRKIAYLTFDDGPGANTEKILRILNQHHVKATFFIVGSSLNKHKSVIKQLVQKGHYVGLHSMSHDAKKLYPANKTSTTFIGEFIQEKKILYDLIGYDTSLIRAPYGSKPYIDKSFRTDIVNAGFKMWDWTIDSGDWKCPGCASKIVQCIKNNLQRRTEVILLHELKQTVQALPEIITHLKQQGYELHPYRPDEHVVSNFAMDQRL